MKTLKVIIILSFVFVIFNGCEDKNKPISFNTEKNLMVITPNFDEAISGPIKIEAKNFEKETGSVVRIVRPSWDEMPQKIEESLLDEKINYDIFVVFASWGGSILNNASEEIPAQIKKKIDWDDILPIYKENVLSWNNKDYFFPYDGDNINLYYRKDILNNKIYKHKFKKEYGYELDVPKTWKQFYDISAFFNDWDWDDDGETEYGFAGSRVKGYGTTLHYLTRAAAYAKHPDDKAYYFDTRTMKAKINSPAFIKALEEYIDIMKFGPKHILNFSPAEVRQSFITGEVVLALDWADIGAMSQNAKESLIKDKIGIAKLPGANDVYNYKEQKWEKIYNAPSSIAGNWILVVNKNSKNKELAYEFASYITSKTITSKYIVKGWSGINPSRYSHLNQNESIQNWVNNGFTNDFAKEYLQTISDSLQTKNVINDIRIPAANLYYASLEENIDKAIKKELTPKEALDITAKEWDTITKELGVEKQRNFYKESINE